MLVFAFVFVLVFSLVFVFAEERGWIGHWEVPATSPTDHYCHRPLATTSYKLPMSTMHYLLQLAPLNITNKLLL